ncbi:MAG: hypothetical protein ABIM98_07375 [candidate division WOR-3 bacterium]
MPILPINQILTKEIEISGDSSPFEVSLMPAFSVPLAGNIGNTVRFVAHLKKEKLSFLTLKLESVGGEPGTEATINVRLILSVGGEPPSEFNLISRTASLPFTVSGTIFMRRNEFLIRNPTGYIKLKISFANMTGVSGKCNIGVEMLRDRMD